MELPRKSFRGYEARAVKETYEQVQFLHERRMTGLHEELHMLQEDNKRLEAETGALAARAAQAAAGLSVDAGEGMETAGQELLRAHEEQTRRICELLAAFEALQEQQRQELAAKEAQRAVVLKRIEERLQTAFASELTEGGMQV